MIEFDHLPHDRRHFVHGRIKRGLTSFITSGFNPVSAAGSFLAPVKRPARNVIPRTLTARSSAAGEAGKGLGRRVKFGGGSSLIRGIAGPGSAAAAGFPQISAPPIFGRCIPPFFSDGQGGCELDLVPGPGGGGTGTTRDFGGAVMGRYGAAEVPGQAMIRRLDCRPGMILGDDDLCYNRSQIKNSERQWPRGRRPLLTGGDMRAISVAARAGARLERTTKRLQKIGLMKKPSKPQRRITSGSTEHHHHS